MASARVHAYRANMAALPSPRGGTGQAGQPACAFQDRAQDRQDRAQDRQDRAQDRQDRAQDRAQDRQDRAQDRELS